MNGGALLIIGSPRPRTTSGSLGAYLLRRLAAGGLATGTVRVRDTAPLLTGSTRAELLILSCPLYVDSLPAPVIAAMELLAGRPGSLKGRRLVAVLNCGLPEAAQCHTALAACQQFADETKLEWAGGLALGLGEAIAGRPLAERGGLTSHIRQALDLTAAALLRREPVPVEAQELMARQLLPSRLFALCVGVTWLRRARRHGAWRRLNARPYQQGGGPGPCPPPA